MTTVQVMRQYSVSGADGPAGHPGFGLGVPGTGVLFAAAEGNGAGSAHKEGAAHDIAEGDEEEV